MRGLFGIVCVYIELAMSEKIVKLLVFQIVSVIDWQIIVKNNID